MAERNFHEWLAGIDAYNDGKSRHSNPYEGGTEEHSAWEAGWYTGQEDEEFREAVTCVCQTT